MRDSEIGPKKKLFNWFCLDKSIYFPLLFLLGSTYGAEKFSLTGNHERNNPAWNSVRTVHVCIIQISKCFQQLENNDSRILAMVETNFTLKSHMKNKGSNLVWHVKSWVLFQIHRLNAIRNHACPCLMLLIQTMSSVQFFFPIVFISQHPFHFL